MKSRRHLQPRQATRHASRGLTLIEMVSVMLIVATLLAIGVPSFKYIGNSNRVASEVNGLLGDLQFARAEAIREGQAVSVCVSSDGATCLANSTSWQNGWIVFSDVNGNGVFNAANDTLLRVQATFTGTDTFNANNSISSITFNREGFAAIASGTVITLHTTPVSNNATRCLTLGTIGMTAVQGYDGATCT